MPTTTQSRVDLRLETRFAALLHHFDRYRRAVDVQSTLGIAELRLLWLLTEGEPKTLREVSEDLHLEQSTVNRQVNAAVQSGLLARSRSSTSSPYVFEPTAHGRATFESETAFALGVYSRVLEDMGDESATRLLELLAQFVDLYGSAVDEIGTSTPS